MHPEFFITHGCVGLKGIGYSARGRWSRDTSGGDRGTSAGMHFSGGEVDSENGTGRPKVIDFIDVPSMLSG